MFSHCGLWGKRLPCSLFTNQADISALYLAGIERRRTWVSDKTLQSLAKALNLFPWELIYTLT
jgi:transcriptional regulator with XRE-family HTH domain